MPRRGKERVCGLGNTEREDWRSHGDRENAYGDAPRHVPPERCWLRSHTERGTINIFTLSVAWQRVNIVRLYNNKIQLNNSNQVVLIYKRTHKGDPNAEGIFGINGCMGRIRNWEFNSVIGIGGKRPDAGSENIAYKINYIGIGARKVPVNPKDGWPYVIFANFRLYEENGILLEEIAPNLYKHMYDVDRRVIKSSSLPTIAMHEEVLKILKLAENAPPSIPYENFIQGLNPRFENSLSIKELYAANKKVKGCR